MKRFNFTLARLHEFKSSVLDREKLTLASMRAELLSIDENINNVNKQIEKIKEQIMLATQKGITVFELKKLEFQIESSRNVLEVLHKQRKEQKDRVDNQLKVVMSVKSEVSGLEKLKDKQREEYDYAVAKEDAENIGELVSGQFVRKSSQ